MKKTIKKVLSFALVTTMLASSLCGLFSFPAAAESYDNRLTLTINGTDCNTSNGSIILYPNKTSSVRAINASEYYFRYSKIMVFDKDGYLIEAGGDMFANSPSVTGSAQEHVYVPAGGFAIAFNPNTATSLYNCYKVAIEGAVFYNSTISVIYEVKGSYSGNTLTIEYDNPVPAPESAKKFLFVGNSSTYFNGTPIKFKGLAQAAGVDVDVVYCTYGSAYLYEFANENHERGKAFRNHLKNTEFDYVVLQDAGGCTYADTKPTMSTLLPLIEENGAEALLYMRYSSNSNPASRFESAKKHYINYTRLSLEHGLTCAPAASAFLICTDKYADINLYADDNSHHSKEGSYLIACVMLYTYLGIDPVGVEYDAQLGADVARKLQECAKLACEEGYDYGITEDDLKPEENSYYVDGVKYDCVTLNKPYVSDGGIYTDDQNRWNDYDANKKLIGKYTDGNFAGTNGGSTAIGCHKGSVINIDIDLQGKYDIKALKTQLFGRPGWGITDPLDASKNIYVTFSYSLDGKEFILIGKANAKEALADEGWTKCVYTLLPETNIEAKYIRATIYNTGFLWCDEISAYGIEGGNIAANKEYEISGVGERTDSYCAKLTDGAISDTLGYGKGDASTWFGFYYHTAYSDVNAPNKLGTVTFDFEKLHTIDKVKVHTFFGNTSGIQSPEYISVETSEDGVTFKEVARNEYPETSASSIEWAVITLEEAAVARYVRIGIKLRNTFAFINEIQVLGEEYTSADPDPDPDPDYMLGDVSGDGTIDKFDYIFVKRSVMETITLDDTQLLAADVTQDGVVDKFDYIYIKRHVMGTLTIGG